MGGAIGAGRTQLSGYVDIDNCIFESNKANGATFINCNGGAIYCLGYVVIKNCTLKNNYAYDYGGAVYAEYILVNYNTSSKSIDILYWQCG
ncbi:hypothetical protein [uncultured Methanobrevibacter sp.]|uniref:hypothetical protein n=1 Tax=uncultured Methanobrevibacter sp. TaxID=253161 RepID=UPI0025E29671|nr:hypothetical protein [uncultured Methanobrevibacter sp.]